MQLLITCISCYCTFQPAGPIKAVRELDQHRDSTIKLVFLRTAKLGYLKLCKSVVPGM